MTDVVPYSPDQCFALAEKIATSALLPQAYRNKPADAAIAMMYGVEMGLSPMTALQRIVVISGKPTLDAQGMVSLIRQSGHSISGDVTDDGATVTGKRCDTGDTMTSTFTMDDAKLAGLAGSSTYKKFPRDMMWARAVSQLGRRLFADVLMAASYSPEEMQAVVDDHPARMSPRPAPTPSESALVDAEAVAEVFDAEVITEAEIVSEPPSDAASDKQIWLLKKRLKEKDLAGDEAKGFIHYVIGHEVTKVADLTKREASAVIDALDEDDTPPVVEPTPQYADDEMPF